MKKVNAQLAQTIILALNESHGSEHKAKQARQEATATMKGLASKAEATALAVFCLEQAIFQGLAKVTTNPIDGKRNDTTSNFKRDIAKAFNDAYPSETSSLRLKTTGKGDARTVTAAIVPVVKKDARETFIDKLKPIMEAINATEAEIASFCNPLLDAYDKEQARLAEVKALADSRKADALAYAHEAITARVSAQLEAKGIKPTEANIKVALAMAM